MCSDSSLNNEYKKTNVEKIFPGELTGNTDGLKALHDNGPDSWFYVKLTIFAFILVHILNGTIVVFT